MPWYVGDGTKIRAVNKADRLEAAPWLGELLELLTDLRVVILSGEAVQRGWDEYAGRGRRARGSCGVRTQVPSTSARAPTRARRSWRRSPSRIVDPPICPTCGAPGILIV